MLKRFKNKKVDGDWLHTNFPCMMACPAHTNAGRYVGLIAEGRFEEAYRLAREPNPLASICGRVCAHPCETACRRGEIDRPISIRALKRFLTEQYGPESKHPINVNEGRGQKRLPYKVAVVGGGPVGPLGRPRSRADGLCGDDLRSRAGRGRNVVSGHTG